MRTNAAMLFPALTLCLASCATAPEGRAARSRSWEAGAAAQEARLAEIGAAWARAGAAKEARGPTALPAGFRAGASAAGPRPEGLAACAAWWLHEAGGDAGAIQAAVDSGAATVVVPDIGRPWVLSRGIRLRSRLELVLERGVELQAMRGAFRDLRECLLLAEGADQLAVSGYGATLRMRKADYRKAPYERSQWRHAVSLRGVAGCRIEGLAIEEAGGDGVYVGTTGEAGRRVACERIELRDLRIANGNRQGISVISARNLLVEGCVVTGTRGERPQSGIDFEPNTGDPGFERCVVRACRFAGNAGPSAQFSYFGKIASKEVAQSVRFEDCELADFPVAVLAHGLDPESKGAVEFVGCSLGGLRLASGTAGFRFSFRSR